MQPPAGLRHGDVGVDRKQKRLQFAAKRQTEERKRVANVLPRTHDGATHRTGGRASSHRAESMAGCPRVSHIEVPFSGMGNASPQGQEERVRTAGQVRACKIIKAKRPRSDEECLQKQAKKWPMHRLLPSRCVLAAHGIGCSRRTGGEDKVQSASSGVSDFDGKKQRRRRLGMATLRRAWCGQLNRIFLEQAHRLSLVWQCRQTSFKTNTAPAASRQGIIR